MNVVPMPSEPGSSKERRLLLLGVLLGHGLLLGLLVFQRANTAPKPLEIELSLSAAEPQPMAQPQPQLQPIAKPPAEKSKPATPQQSLASATLPAQPSVVAPKEPLQNSVRPELVEGAFQPNQGLRQAQSERNEVMQAVTTVLPNADAAYLTNPKPGYPPLSRRLGEQGIVVLNVLVGESGEVQKLEVAKGSGYARLDEAANRAVQSWRFAPGKRAGIAQPMWVKVPISFILEK